MNKKFCCKEELNTDYIDEIKISRSLIFSVVIAVLFVSSVGYFSSKIERDKKLEERLTKLEKTVSRIDTYVAPRQKPKKFLFF